MEKGVTEETRLRYNGQKSEGDEPSADEPARVNSRVLVKWGSRAGEREVFGSLSLFLGDK
jgi:hypothetical protein